MNFKENRNFKQILNILFPIISLILVLILTMRSLIFSQGYIIYRDLFPGQMYYPKLWHPQGSFMALENYKFVTFTGLFLPFMSYGLDVYEKAVYISAMAIAYLSFYLFSYRLIGKIRGQSTTWAIKHAACFLSALIYVTNPAAANIFFDFSLFVGYAFAPLILFIFMEELAGDQTWHYSAIGIAGLWWLSAIKAHWILFGALLLMPPFFCWAVWQAKNRDWSSILSNFKFILTIIALYLSFSAYWLIPFVYASGEKFIGSYAPMTIEAVKYLSFAPLLDTVRLLGNFPAWPYIEYGPPNKFLIIPWTIASLVLPALVLTSVIWFRKHWQVWTLAGFSVFSIILVKGFAPPLGNLYKLLLFDGIIPKNFQWLFRVSSKWNVFLSLSYSGLTSLALAELGMRACDFKWKNKTNNQKASTAILALIATIIAVPLFSWPSFTGDFTGALVPVSLPDAMNEANAWLEKQGGDYKVNWMPITNGRELTWNPKPSGEIYTSLSTLPSIHTSWNRNPMLYYSYAYSALSLGQIKNFGKLLSPLNTKFIALHDDIVTAHIHTGVEPVVVLLEETEEEWSDRFTGQQDLRLAWHKDDITIYEIADAAPPVYVPENHFLTTADLTILTSLSALDEFELNQNAILFDTSRNTGTLHKNIDGLLLKRDAIDYLTFACFPSERLISPAKETYHHAIEEQWSRYDIYQSDWQFALRDHGILQWVYDYGQGMVAYASTGRNPDPTLNVPLEINEKGDYHIWVRALQHSNAGELHISIDGKTLKILDNNYPVTGFVWTDTGKVYLDKGKHNIGISNKAGFAAVNTIAVISDSELKELEICRQNLAESIPNIFLLEAESDFDIGSSEVSQETTNLSSGQGVVIKPNSSIDTTISLPIGGLYTIGVRAASADMNSELTIDFGMKKVNITNFVDSENLSWLMANPIEIDSGEYTIRIEASNDIVIDTFIMITSRKPINLDEIFETNNSRSRIGYQKIDPTRYRVSIEIDQPSLLVLTETYDPLWVASTSNSRVNSIPINGVINGFMLEETGQYELTIQFEPQQWARLGSFVTGGAIISTGALIFFTRKKRQDKCQR